MPGAFSFPRFIIIPSSLRKREGRGSNIHLKPKHYETNLLKPSFEPLLDVFL